MSGRCCFLRESLLPASQESFVATLCSSVPDQHPTLTFANALMHSCMRPDSNMHAYRCPYEEVAVHAMSLGGDAPRGEKRRQRRDERPEAYLPAMRAKWLAKFNMPQPLRRHIKKSEGILLDDPANWGRLEEIFAGAITGLLDEVRFVEIRSCVYTCLRIYMDMYKRICVYTCENSIRVA